MVEGRQVQVARHKIQLVFAQLGQQILGQDQRIDGGRRKRAAHSAAALGDKAKVEFRVMGGQRPAGREVQEGPDGLGLGGGALQHRVGDAGQLADFPGKGAARVGKRGKLLGHPAVPQHHRADLGNRVGPLVQSGGLDIEADDLAGKILLPFPVDHHPVVHIIDVIGLHTVEDLDLFGGVRGVRERLGHAVIRDGNGPVPPGLRPFHHVFVRPGLGTDLGQGVHSGHGGMQVQFHPLFRCVVGLLRFLSLHDGIRL